MAPRSTRAHLINRLKPPLRNFDHVRGNPAAPIVLVEYGDYECRDCARAHDAVQALQRTLGERLAFAFRHFPLTGAHPHATAAAAAAEAAGAQGKFWAMHDLLFAH